MHHLQLRRLHENNLFDVANFIAKLNQKATAHIGYCGTDPDEIANFMENELSDIRYTDSFVCSYREEQLIGIVGFDADLEDQSAEI